MATVHSRIEINPKVMVGKPVIRGTRIPVELILRRLGEGATIEGLLEGQLNGSFVVIQPGRVRISPLPGA